MTTARERLRAIITALAALPISVGTAAAETQVDGTELRALPPIKGGKISDQIRVTECSPFKRTEVTGVVGQPTIFSFPSGEKIYRIVQTVRSDNSGSYVDDKGDVTDAGWHVPRREQVKDIPLVNVVPFWPVRTGYSTMTIITQLQTDGTLTPYPFRLLALRDEDGAAANPGVTLNLTCKTKHHAVAAATTSGVSNDDPPAPRRVSKVSRRKRQTEEEREAAAERIRTDAFNRAGGCQFSAKGDPNSPIIPRCPLTNDIWTLIRLPGLTAKPAVYVSDPAYLCGTEKGEHERLARQHGADDIIVVEEIARRFCLRLGSSVIQLDNLAYNPAGAPTGTGTIAPTVRRRVLKAEK